MTTYEQSPVKKGKGKVGVRTVQIDKLQGDMANYTGAQVNQYRALGYTVKDDGHQYVATIAEEKAAAIERGFEQTALDRMKASKSLSLEDRQEGAFSSTLEEMAPVSPSDFLTED